MLDEVGIKKGRHLLLGVRVLQHLESCLTMGFDYRDLVQTPEHCHAAVRNFYGAGADGYSTQNYFDVDAYDTLGVLRDPDLIAKEDRHYVFYPIWGPNQDRQAGYYEGDFPYHAEEIVLPREAPGVRGTLRFRMCEHLPEGAGAMVLCRPAIVRGDELEIDINGETIPAEDIQYEWPEGDDQLPVCRVGFAAGSVWR